MTKFRLFTIITLVLALSACSLRPPGVSPTQNDYLQAIPKYQPATESPSVREINPSQKTMTNATLHTNLGDIEIVFYPEPTLTVENFIKLASSGFYDGVTFHRVISGFMIQTGDPLSKDDDWSDDGTGGPGYTFADEINQHRLVRGSVAMANAGPNTNGSQFFIVTAEATPWLDGKHTNFGYVVSGLEVVAQIDAVTTNANDHPLQNIIISHITLK